MKDKHELYDVLGSEIRRKILIFIGERGAVRFTDLKNYTGISVGSLYYHLNILEKLVIQTSDKRYTLSEEGQEAYKLLTEKNVEFSKQSITTKILYGIMLSLIISKISERRLIRLPLTTLLLISYIYIPYMVHLTPLGFFYTFTNKNYIVYSLLTWLLIYFFSDVLASLFFNKWKFGHLLLLELSVIPIFVLHVTHSFLFMFNLSNEYVLLIFQSWSLIILGFILAYTKGLRVEQGLLISLILLYINLIFIYK
ncbi:MAG: winged helix-turn-helix domain-containing protein [Thermoprotei archaeon]